MGTNLLIFLGSFVFGTCFGFVIAGILVASNTKEDDWNE